MKIAVIEVGGNRSKQLGESLVEEIVNLDLTWKKAGDFFDALALLKKNTDADMLLLVAPHEVSNEQWLPFLNALAEFEADEGKPVLKVFYEEPEDLEKELAKAKQAVLNKLS